MGGCLKEAATQRRAAAHPIQLSAQMWVVTRSMEGTTWLARKSCPSCAAQGDDAMPVRRLPAPGFRNTLRACRGGRQQAVWQEHWQSTCSTRATLPAQDRETVRVLFRMRC